MEYIKGAGNYLYSWLPSLRAKSQPVVVKENKNIVVVPAGDDFLLVNGNEDKQVQEDVKQAIEHELSPNFSLKEKSQSIRVEDDFREQEKDPIKHEVRAKKRAEERTEAKNKKKLGNYLEQSQRQPHYRLGALLFNDDPSKLHALVDVPAQPARRNSR